MFILILKYLEPLPAIENALAAHMDYLEKYYVQGKFIASGPQNPRTGGAILCLAQNRREVESIIKEDPFYSRKLAAYEILAFTPTKCSPELELLLAP